MASKNKLIGIGTSPANALTNSQPPLFIHRPNCEIPKTPPATSKKMHTTISSQADTNNNFVLNNNNNNITSNSDDES